MAKISNQLDELAREARRIGIDVGIISCFSLDYKSTSEISEFLYRLRDEFYAVAEKIDSINEQIHEEKGENRIEEKNKNDKY